MIKRAKTYPLQVANLESSFCYCFKNAPQNVLVSTVSATVQYSLLPTSVCHAGSGSRKHARTHMYVFVQIFSIDSYIVKLFLVFCYVYYYSYAQ
jgi:hypothetical protein